MLGLDYWTLAGDFLNLVEAGVGELVDKGNLWVVTGDSSVSKKYDELTKWSDHRIGVPLLFNFYHGLELILKGFLAEKGQVPTHHRLTGLLADFTSKYPNTELAGIIGKYTTNLDPKSPLGQFFNANGVSVDQWYEALKYPESKKGKVFDHMDLQYGEMETLEFWKDIGQAAQVVREEAANLGWS